MLLLRAQRLAALALAALSRHGATLAPQLRAPCAAPAASAAAALAHCVVTLTSPEAWRLEGDAMATDEDAGGAPADAVLLHLLRGGAFRTLRALVLAATPTPAALPAAADAAPASVLDALLLHVWLRADAAPGAAAVTPRRARAAPQLLSLPLLWRRCPGLGAAVARVWPAALRALADELPRGATADDARALLPADASYPAAAWLLGNLLEGAPAALAAARAAGGGGAHAAAALGFAAATEALLPALPRAALGAPDEEEDAPQGDASAGAGGVSAHLPPPHALAAQLALLSDGALLRDLIHTVMPPPPPPDVASSPADAAAAAAAVRLCSLLHCALSRLRGAERGRMLASLAFSAGLVPRLWACIRSCADSGLWAAPTGGATGAAAAAAAAAPGWLLPLAVLAPVYRRVRTRQRCLQLLSATCEICCLMMRCVTPLLACSFLLLTADDEEFYEQGASSSCLLLLFSVLWSCVRFACACAHARAAPAAAGNPLTLRDNVRLVTLLRDSLWQLIWTEAPSSGPQAAAAAASPSSPAALRAAATASLARLFAQLHARNGRRRFAPPEAFFREELSRRDAVAERLLADAAAADADADMDADGGGGAGGAPDVAAQPASRAAHLLAAAPALAPFHLRAALFQELCAADRDAAREGAGRHGAAGWDPLAAIMGSTLTIRRDHLFEDGLSGLGALPAGALRGPVRIRFVNALGAPEAGVDGGGLFKDFLDDLVRSAFDPRAGLWRTTPAHALYPSPASGGADARHLEVFRFQGAVLAKALFEGMLAELPLAGFFLSKLRGDAMELNDLASLDEALYRSLLFLKRYEGDHAALCLFFTTTRDAADAAEVELVPRGRDTPVTARNKLTYIHLVANYKLTQQMRAQCDAFLQGFHSLIRPQWVRMFSADELQQLIGGSPEGVSVADLRRWTSYSGGFTAEHPTILLLWEVVAELAPPQQAAFLKFVTACSRAPLLGFRTLEPRFCVHRAGVARSDAPDEGADLERLPTAATCMVRSVRAGATCPLFTHADAHACAQNLLKLPPYQRKADMVQKLLYAISANAGFDLS